MSTKLTKPANLGVSLSSPSPFSHSAGPIGKTKVRITFLAEVCKAVSLRPADFQPRLPLFSTHFRSLLLTPQPCNTVILICTLETEKHLCELP